MAKATGFHHGNGATGALFEDIYIVDGKRTPFGKYCGSLSSVSPTDLGILASRAVVASANINPKEIAQAVVANIGQASADSFFLPRHIALYSGLNLSSTALMAQRICGSGIEIIGLAAQEIGLGKGKVVLATGTETMSRFPVASYGARMGFPLGRPEYVDFLWEALNDTAAVPMGVTADNLAKKYHLSRQEVDEFALSSQNSYYRALESGFFNEEIFPVESGVLELDGYKPRKYKVGQKKPLTQDENPRKTSIEKLAKLPCVFSKSGPTTAGSASGIVDGAAACILASGDFVKAHGLKPKGKLRGFASIGVPPEIMGTGPVDAIKSVLGASKLNLNDVDLVEINEAFAAQVLSCAKALELDLNKLNIHGGAVSIGHPLAATGVRLVTTLLNSLKVEQKSLGIASACIGGGQGIAMIVENIS